MTNPKIESRSNEKIKAAVALCESSRARRLNREFMLEGLRLCCDAAITGIRIKRLFYTRQAAENQRMEAVFKAAESMYEITEDVAKRLAQTQNSQGVFCVCEMRENTLSVADILSGGCYIALENIQDPSNLGAICRTAEALGIAGAVMCGCCDIYNPKSQRAAMGSLLRLPTLVTDELCGVLSEVKSRGVPLYATTPDGEKKHITAVDFLGGGIAVIGNEANGVSEAVFDLCTPVTIPMAGRAESLNASMAAAIVMWEMLRGSLK